MENAVIYFIIDFHQNFHSKEILKKLLHNARLFYNLKVQIKVIYVKFSNIFGKPRKLYPHKTKLKNFNNLKLTQKLYNILRIVLHLERG